MVQCHQNPELKTQKTGKSFPFLGFELLGFGNSEMRKTTAPLSNLVFLVTGTLKMVKTFISPLVGGGEMKYNRELQF